MNPNPGSKSDEIERNLQSFVRMLPDLIREHAGQYVLLRHGEAVDFFDSAIDAQIAGSQRFDDVMFSFQHIVETAEELGYYSFALHRRSA